MKPKMLRPGEYTPEELSAEISVQLPERRRFAFERAEVRARLFAQLERGESPDRIARDVPLAGRKRTAERLRLELPTAARDAIAPHK